MMRFWAVLIVAFSLSRACFAQYSNDWVQYNQPYYKISVASDGIYRLTYEQLQTAGVPVGSIDPRLIQVYHRGVEQAVAFKHNQTPADSKFDAGEYLEFYGHRNDGELDTKLYQPTSIQPHKYYNLFSDTTAYFLTVNPVPVQGKRIPTFDQVNNTGLTKDASQINEQLQVFTSEYATGYIELSFVVQSYFDQGEGWTGVTICTVNSGCVDQRDFLIDQLTNGVMSEQPTLELQLTGRIDGGHKAEIYVGPTAGSVRLLTTTTFSNYEIPTINQTISWSDIGSDGRMIVRVKALGIGGERDRMSVSYIKIRAQQKFDMASATAKLMELNPTSDVSHKSYIEIDNAPSGTRLWDITDQSNIVQIGTRTSGSLLTAVVDNTDETRKIYASSSFIVPDLSSIEPISFRELDTNAKYIIISNKVLTQAAGGYDNPVKAVAEYRASVAGGSYDTLTVMIDQLYNQFNYGETSPNGIFEFMKYMVGKGNPQYLFLIGKGRDVSQGYYRHTPGLNETKDLVPTAGNPASDMAFTAGLKGELFVPAVATGRLTANTSLQVANYLNKVKETESASLTDLWRKQLLHISGGEDASEIVRFRTYCQGFEQIARGDYLGGEVTTLSKRGFQTVEFINVTQQVNAGLNMITFFGHSAPNITDVDIGYVSDPILNYNNVGKYPVLFLNGCNAGEFFNDGENFGENWANTGSKGARNVIGNSSFGFELALDQYTTYFYDVGFSDSLFITKGIGDVQQEVARRYMNAFGTTRSMFTAQVEQLILLGDPALRMNAATKPDFETSSAAIDVISSDGKPINALSDSLIVQVITRNFGRATKMPLEMKIVHTINNSTVEYNPVFKSVLFQDTLQFAIPRGAGNFYGDNKIQISLDPNNKIDELNEDNNTGEWTKSILFNGTQNLQPANFSVITNTTADLLFQDTDVLAGQKTYQVQIDTNRLFNSPFLQTKTITGAILMKTQFNLLDTDSIAYFWRSKPTDKSDDEWETTSFSYIKDGSKGWAQISFDQMLSNSFNDLAPDETKKRFDFRKTSVNVVIKTFGDQDSEPGISPSVVIDNQEYYYSPSSFSCRNNTINLIAFNKSTVIPYLGIPFTFTNSFGRSCGREPQLINSFLSTELEGSGVNDGMAAYINNLQTGDSVILFTVGDPGFASWPADIKFKLNELGINSADLDNSIPGEPLIIFCRKGGSTANIIRSTDPSPREQTLSIVKDLTGSVTSGSITSVVVGPALQWHSLYQQVKSKESTDNASIDVYRIGFDGTEELILLDLTGNIMLDNVDASVYPYLKLVYKTSDPDNLTPAQLKNWLVSFDPAPDGLLLPDPNVKPVTLSEGAMYQSDFMFVNISDVAFQDSLASTYSVLTQSTRQRETQSFKIKGPGVGDTTKFSRTMKTLGKVGVNDITTAVNVGPVAEVHLQNNSVDLAAYLTVLKDVTNPVLEVTVDGRYLNDGDFVSANPLIRGVLHDNNTLLQLKDTTSLNLFLSYPCANDDCPLQRINFSRSDVKWQSGNGEVMIEFTPKNLPEGTYKLYANGKDVTGNPSGVDPYEVSFVVDHEPGMIFYDPYPNPSSYGFNFDFDAVGDSAPQDFSLAIIDATGRAVASFTTDDAPSLRVGMNQLRWTGMDARGNRVADGLYVYQLIIKTGDRDYKKSGRLMIIR